MPAIRRYDGPLFRVVRRGLREGADVETYVLSARFGLFHADNEIPWYDQRLTRTRGAELASGVGACVHRIADSGRFRAACVCAGREYLWVLAPHLDRLRAAVPVTVATGSLGEKLTRLSVWLGEPRAVRRVPSEAVDCLSVRGVRVTAKPAEVMALAGEAVAACDPTALRCHGWHVPTNGARVSPKWLIHKLTGLPVGCFHSDDARRVLAALGVTVLPCT